MFTNIRTVACFYKPPGLRDIPYSVVASQLIYKSTNVSVFNTKYSCK